MPVFNQSGQVVGVQVNAEVAELRRAINSASATIDRLIEAIEKGGIVGSGDGITQREILMGLKNAYVTLAEHAA